MKHLCLAIIFLLCGVATAQNSTAPATATQSQQSGQTAAASQPKIDPVKEANIRKLMQLTGADNMTGVMLNSIKPSLINSLPPGNYRSQLVDLLLQKLGSKVSAEVIGESVSVYDKYFTNDDILQLIAFYDTPVGKKMVTVVPQMMAEIMQTSLAQGQKLGLESLQEVLAEHPELKQQMEEAEKTAKST